MFFDVRVFLGAVLLGVHSQLEINSLAALSLQVQSLIVFIVNLCAIV